MTVVIDYLTERQACAALVTTKHGKAQARSNRLPVLAASINDHLGAADAATRRGLEHAIAAGLLLLEAKELVGHGDWLTWLQANCHVGARQAQAFMRLARHRHRLEAIKCAPSAHLTIHAAEALVGRPKPEPQYGLPGQLDLLDGEEVIARPPALRGRSGDEWHTPAAVLDLARDVLGDIDIDPASNAEAQKTVKARRYFTLADSGLSKPWHGRVWLNPPYSQPSIAQFVGKLIQERRSGRVSAAIMLTNNCTDTRWFHAALECADVVNFSRGRIRFCKPTGEIGAPEQGQAIFYFGQAIERFIGTFARLGTSVMREKRTRETAE